MSPPPTLDEAWAEAEAALPEGWSLLIGDERRHGTAGWWATASEPLKEAWRGFKIVSTSDDGTLYDTPAAALQALAAKLRSDLPPPLAAKLRAPRSRSGVAAMSPPLPETTVSLDEAWAEAEAALPKGWHVGRLLRTAPASEEAWWAEAQKSGGPNRNYLTVHTEWHATKEAALQALAAKLRATRP